jgi:hypothetical protein
LARKRDRAKLTFVCGICFCRVTFTAQTPSILLR